jgi:hypothetical protein
MPRCSWFALVFAVFVPALASGIAQAQPLPPPPRVLPPPRAFYGERGEAFAFRQRNAGAIDGQVIGINYASGTMTVRTRRRGIIDVMVLPSTSIQARQSGFQTIADIVRGERVHVLMSRRGARFIAQIIILKN